MSVHQKWKYVYWSVMFSILTIVIEVFHLLERSIADSWVAVFTIICLSGTSTYIYKKIPWRIPSFYYTYGEGGKKHYDLD